MPGPVLCTEVSTVKPSKRQEVDGSIKIQSDCPGPQALGELPKGPLQGTARKAGHAHPGEVKDSSSLEHVLGSDSNPETSWKLLHNLYVLFNELMPY